MKQPANPWSAKRPHRGDPNADYNPWSAKCPDGGDPNADYNPWSAKRPDLGDPNADYSQIHKLKDVPPYDNIYVTSHGIEALRTQSQKFKAVYNTSYGNRIPGEKDARKVYGREYSYNAFEEENINIEAEEFIREEHQKLNFGGWMSTNSINYD